MAKLKKPQQRVDPGPVVSGDVLDLDGFSIETLLYGPRPGREDPALDRRWHKARWRLLRVADTKFDPRQILTMTVAQVNDWRARRLAWLQEQLTDGASENFRA